MLSQKTEKTFLKIRRTYYAGRGTDADSYSVHLKASVVQLFQHSFGFKVTILMVKRVEGQRVYFAPLERIIETIIFTGSSILVFCLVFENF